MGCVYGPHGAPPQLPTEALRCERRVSLRHAQCYCSTPAALPRLVYTQAIRLRTVTATPRRATPAPAVATGTEAWARCPPPSIRSAA